MKVRTTKRLASLLGVGMIALAILAYVFLVLPNGELGQIGGFALLQGIEAKYRNNPEVFDPIVLKNPS